MTEFTKRQIDEQFGGMVVAMQPRVQRPCPEWCEVAPGHQWDDADFDDEGGVFEERTHGCKVGETGVVELVTTECATSTRTKEMLRDDLVDDGQVDGEVADVYGPSRFAPVTIGVYAADLSLTPEGAERLAHELLEAATKARALNG